MKLIVYGHAREQRDFDIIKHNHGVHLICTIMFRNKLIMNSIAASILILVRDNEFGQEASTLR